MTKPTKVIKIEVPVAKFRRSRKDWDGHCGEAYLNGDPRPCEAPELCWPDNCCFRDGTDEPLVARPTETMLVVPKSDLDSALSRIAELEPAQPCASQGCGGAVSDEQLTDVIQIVRNIFGGHSVSRNAPHWKAVNDQARASIRAALSTDKSGGAA